MEKQRNAILAFVLSLILPGLGQVYSGNSRRGYTVSLFGMTIVLLCGSILLNTFTGLIVLFIIYLLWHVLAGIDSTFCVLDRQLIKRATIWSYLGFIACILVFNSASLSLFKKFFFEAFKIPSSTMEPTVKLHDYIITKRAGPFDSNLKRGDIVVFTLVDDPSTTILKRVVGLPGETIEVKGKEVLVNEVALAEPYAQYVLGGKRNFSPAIVPQGMVFLLGDNRDMSKDSRYWADVQGNPSPFLPISRIEGTALYVYWNSDDWSSRKGIQLRFPSETQ